MFLRSLHLDFGAYIPQQELLLPCEKHPESIKHRLRSISCNTNHPAYQWGARENTWALLDTQLNKTFFWSRASSLVMFKSSPQHIGKLRPLQAQRGKKSRRSILIFAGKRKGTWYICDWDYFIFACWNRVIQKAHSSFIQVLTLLV